MRNPRFLHALPIPPRNALRKLGADLRVARLRRRLPTTLAAERAFLNRKTLAKTEKGNGLILLGGQLNGKPAAFLLDSGANNSVADVHPAGLDDLKLDALRSTGSAGAEGACAIREVNLSREHRSWLNRRVCIMDLSDASRRMGVRVDGFIGAEVQRVLRCAD